VDFSDAILLAGTNVDICSKLVELGDCAGVLTTRSASFGGADAQQDEQLDESGLRWRLHRPSLPHYPLGWTPDAVFAPGGGAEQSFVVWGAAYTIAGNGTTPTRGLMTQSGCKTRSRAAHQANTDYIGAPAARVTPLSSQGTLHIQTLRRERAINTTGLHSQPRS